MHPENPTWVDFDHLVTRLVAIEKTVAELQRANGDLKTAAAYLQRQVIHQQSVTPQFPFPRVF